MRNRLEALIACGFPRLCGHTYAAVNGVKNSDNAVLVVADARSKSRIRQDYDLPVDKLITVNRVEEGLRGTKKAVVYDHRALETLVKSPFSLSETLYKNIEDLDDILKEVLKIAESYSNEITTRDRVVSAVINRYKITEEDIARAAILEL